MVKSSYLWLVETNLGTWKDWLSRGRKGPTVKQDGTIQLDKAIPKDFFSAEKQVGDDITATMLKRISRIKRLELIQNEQQLDWQTMLLILSVVGNIIAIGFLVYSLV